MLNRFVLAGVLVVIGAPTAVALWERGYWGIIALSFVLILMRRDVRNT
jgi:hypothetical protein